MGIHTHKVELSLGKDAYFPFERITVNGLLFYIDKTNPQNGQRNYYSVQQVPLPDSIFCIRGVEDGEVVLDGFLPSKILVNGRVYQRRCGSYYTPQSPEESEAIQFFDYISDQYESLIDRALNMGLIYRFFERFRNLRKNSQKDAFKILDYGVGTGLSYLISHKKSNTFWRRVTLHGCDLSPAMVRICRQKSFENVDVCHYAQTCYENQSFDLVFASFVVHYFIDQRPFYEFYRILKPGGMCIFNIHKPEPNFKTQYTSWLTSIGFSNLTFRELTVKTQSMETTQGKMLHVVESFRPLSPD